MNYPNINEVDDYKKENQNRYQKEQQNNRNNQF